LPVLIELRRKAQDIATAELDRYQPHLDELDPIYQEKVTQMVHRIVNKLLHEPTVRLKASAAEGNGVEYAQAIRELFDLDVSPTAPPPASIALDDDVLEYAESTNGRG
jgi:glutamyl-tRNA reductase